MSTVLTTWEYELAGLEVLIEGRYTDGQHFLVTPRTIQPPDPAEIRIDHVWLCKEKIRIDILPALRDEVVAEIELDLLEGIEQEVEDYEP